MITASGITQSASTDVSPRAEWPMDTYISAWKLFRTMSDENELTARHILSRPRWPRDAGELRLVDFGCGDGTLVEALILECNQPIPLVHLVDPDEELLKQAKDRVAGLEPVRDVRATLGRAEEVVGEVTRDADAALAVHLVYLLKKSETNCLLTRTARDVPLYVVMDEPTSVFTKLWKVTAQKYWTRLIQAHQVIQSLARTNRYSVEMTRFETHLMDPFRLGGKERDLILSFLSYTDFRNLDARSREWARAVISEHSFSGRVVCSCMCYEVVRIA